MLSTAPPRSAGTHTGPALAYSARLRSAGPGIGTRKQDRFLAGVAAGSIVTPALNEPGAALPDKPRRSSLAASSTARKIGVPYAAQADWIVVTAGYRGCGGVAEGQRGGGKRDTDVQHSDEYVVASPMSWSPMTTCWRRTGRRGSTSWCSRASALFSAGLVAVRCADRRDYVANREQFGSRFRRSRPWRRSWRGVHRLAHLDIGCHLSGLRLSEGLRCDEDLDVLGYWLASQAPPVMQLVHHLQRPAWVWTSPYLDGPLLLVRSKESARLIGGPINTVWTWCRAQMYIELTGRAETAVKLTAEYFSNLISGERRRRWRRTGTVRPTAR